MARRFLGRLPPPRWLWSLLACCYALISQDVFNFIVQGHMVFFPVVRRCHLLRICVVNVFRVVQSHGSASGKATRGRRRSTRYWGLLDERLWGRVRTRRISFSGCMTAFSFCLKRKEELSNLATLVYYRAQTRTCP